MRLVPKKKSHNKKLSYIAYLDKSPHTIGFYFLAEDVLPLSKRIAINLHDAILHKCLRSYKFIIACIVHHIHDTRFSGDT